MDYQRNWLEESGSDDSHGRALWALGTVLGRSNTPALHNMAVRVFQQSLLAILETTSPRAWAFALIGIHEYLQRFAGDRRVSQVQEELAGRLLALYQNNRADGWHWFEDKLTYCNAALSHAMLLCGESIPNPAMTEVGLGVSRLAGRLAALGYGRKAFCPDRFQRFLSHRAANVPASINSRWRHRRWSLPASKLTVSPEKKAGIQEARRAFEWFLGRNDLHLPVYDPTTGGCRDGLHSDRPNENQGAESTLAFLQSLWN